MRTSLAFVVLAVAVGCSSQTGTDTVVTPPVVTTPAAESADPAVVADGMKISLSPENTMIQFVGTHVGPTPDPKARVGSFGDFSGVAEIADDDIASIAVEIQMASVTTEQDKLTNHLQAPDFFDVRQFPTAKFETTRIARDKDGNHLVTGNLTLHGETKEINFPASVGMVDGQLEFSAKLELDRTEFGMDQNTDKVNKEVSLTIGIGKNAAATH